MEFFAFRSAGMFSVVEPLIIVFILTKLFKKKSSWFIGIIICILIFLVNYLLLNRNAIYNNDKVVVGLTLKDLDNKFLFDKYVTGN